MIWPSPEEDQDGQRKAKNIKRKGSIMNIKRKTGEILWPPPGGEDGAASQWDREGKKQREGKMKKGSR